MIHAELVELEVRLDRSATSKSPWITLRRRVCLTYGPGELFNLVRQ